MTGHLDEPVTAAADREGRDDWLAERPAREDPGYDPDGDPHIDPWRCACGERRPCPDDPWNQVGA